MHFVTAGTTPNYCIIYINLESHFGTKTTENFIIALSSSYLEELFHCDDPKKKHKEFAEPLCSAIERFLEIKLPDEYKQKVLKRLLSS